MIWTGSEIAYLRRHAGDGAAAIAAELGRSRSSVERQAHRLRISLRKPGSRRGLVLGQARGVSISAQIRGDIVSGRVSATAIAERMRVNADAELCPACGARAAEIPSTGYCKPCHLQHLATAHRDELAVLMAKRELWQARQEISRERRAAEAAAT